MALTRVDVRPDGAAVVRRDDVCDVAARLAPGGVGRVGDATEAALVAVQVPDAHTPPRLATPQLTEPTTAETTMSNTSTTQV